MKISKRIYENNIIKTNNERHKIDVYLELYGEETPGLHKATIKPGPESKVKKKSAHSSKSASESGSETVSHVYEYGWTIGIIGTREDWLKKMRRDDNALIIQLLFKTTETRYRVKEIAPSLLLFKDLKPSLLDKVSNYWQSFSPILGIMDKLPIIKSGSDTLLSLIPSALSSLNLTQLSSNELRWYVKSISTPLKEQGIEWCISKKAIKRAGNRITGNITMFIEECEDRTEEEKETTQDKSEFQIELRSRLLLRGFSSREYWLPRIKGGKPVNPLEITVKPRL